MDDDAQATSITIAGPLPMQQHACTAVIEELVALTPDAAWDDAD